VELPGNKGVKFYGGFYTRVVQHLFLAQEAVADK
jgi:hypothetical protein